MIYLCIPQNDIKQQKTDSYGNEENIPAFAQEENKQAWFPSENVYGKRTQNLGCTSCKGSQEIVRFGRVDVQVRLTPSLGQVTNREMPQASPYL